MMSVLNSVFVPLVAALLALALVARCQLGPGPECLCFQEVGDGRLFNPTNIRSFNDGTGRLLVSEQRGMIWIYNAQGNRNPQPYLDMRDTALAFLQGLLSFALHPEYSDNGRIYLHYSAEHSENFYQRLSEMARSSSNPDVIDVSTERVVWEVQYPVKGARTGHLGGGLVFGHDGYLYAGFGDGYCCMDPLDNGQNKSTPHGTVVRIDVDTRTGNLGYGIPPDNPFLDDPEAIPELYVYGLRQGYTMVIDEGDPSTGEGRGRMFLGDVGDSSFEEVDELFPGHNYGWPFWEGPLCHEPTECDAMEQYTEPIIAYNRSVGICVILGGVYRGCQNPSLAGWMVFFDYANPIEFVATEQNGTWTVETIPRCETCPEGLTNTRPNWVLGAGLDHNGEIWFTSSNNTVSMAGGSIFKVVDPNTPGTCPGS